jgi:hypothetical protein
MQVITDKLLVNLKILSKIEKNGRIARSYDGIISLENESVYQPLKRFLAADSRKQALFEINSIITECIDTVSHILNSKHMNTTFCNTDEYVKGCESLGLLLTEMNNAKIGIQNLKFTYQTDLNTASQIDIMILKINTTIKDTTQKILYLQSFIQHPSYRPFIPLNENELTPIYIDTSYDMNNPSNPMLNMVNVYHTGVPQSHPQSSNNQHDQHDQEVGDACNV